MQTRKKLASTTFVTDVCGCRCSSRGANSASQSQATRVFADIGGKRYITSKGIVTTDGCWIHRCWWHGSGRTM